MTDSTIDTNSSDGGADVGFDADELFGGIGDEALEVGAADGGDEGDASRSESDRDATDQEGADSTAADVFDRLRADAEHDADGVLAGESPEDIIADADRPAPESDRRRDGADDLVDEDALEDLLLTGRTKEREFLWIDPDDPTEPDGDESAAEHASVDEAAREDATSESPPSRETGVDGDAVPESESETDPETDPVVSDAEDAAAGGDETDEVAVVPDVTGLDRDEETDDESTGVIGRLRSILGRLF